MRADIRHVRHPSAALGKRKLPLPMADGLRTAQLSPRGLLYVDSHFFALDDLPSLVDFEPHVLVGSAAELETLARATENGQARFATLDRALLVVTDCRDVPLRDASRLVLWRAFGLPMYELLLGGDGAPIAFECDAHDGWHIEDNVAFSTVNGELWYQRKRELSQGTGLTGELSDDLCPCGQRGKRILNPAMDFRDPVRHYLAQTA